MPRKKKENLETETNSYILAHKFYTILYTLNSLFREVKYNNFSIFKKYKNLINTALKECKEEIEKGETKEEFIIAYTITNTSFTLYKTSKEAGIREFNKIYNICYEIAQAKNLFPENLAFNFYKSLKEAPGEILP